MECVFTMSTEFKPSPEQLDIMRHTRDRAAGGFYCGDSEAMRELVANDLMQFAGTKPFVPDKYFTLTRKGRSFLS